MTKTEIMETKALPCGCIPGFYLCPEAVRLWALVGDTYEQGRLTGDWKEYENARENYRKHLERRKNQCQE